MTKKNKNQVKDSIFPAPRLFPAEIYRERRKKLAAGLEKGLLLFVGNQPCPVNYAANHYLFRQDSNFLYYWGLDEPGLAAVMDLEEGEEILFGNNPDLEDVVWTGPRPSLEQRASQVAVKQVKPLSELSGVFGKARKAGRQIHYLPAYRQTTSIFLANLLGTGIGQVKTDFSVDFTRAVIEQRSVKGPEEIEQIERALDLTAQIHHCAMKLTRPGVCEQEVVAAMQALVYAKAGGQMAYSPIFTRNGHIMHNPWHHCRLASGDLVINDSGAESELHYASDITRTLPVSGRFDSRQKEIYQIVNQALDACIASLKPGVAFRDLHLQAGIIISRRLVDLGLMKGDPDEIVHQGAHTLFFPVGLGHMMGLDVHDMESLGEDMVGYDNHYRRDSRFGFCYLRLAKPVEKGYVVTIELGIYFIKELISQWKEQGRFKDFIDYSKLEHWYDFGGVRLEDDILVTEDGCRILGPSIARSISAVEEAMGG